MSDEATQEQPGVSQTCLCVQRTNDALRAAYPGVKVSTNLANGRPVIATVRVEGKGKTPLLFGNFCPWCGVKYER
jgi:hypothetical protein